MTNETFNDYAQILPPVPKGPTLKELVEAMRRRPGATEPGNPYRTPLVILPADIATREGWKKLQDIVEIAARVHEERLAVWRWHRGLSPLGVLPAKEYDRLTRYMTVDQFRQWKYEMDCERQRAGYCRSSGIRITKLQKKYK